MALFQKKITLEDILKALPTLSDEEKKALSDKIGETAESVEAPEAEPAVENIEEEAETAPEADENTEDNAETAEESTEDGAPVEEEAESTDTEGEEATEQPPEENGAEPYELEENTPEEVEPPLDESEKDNTAEIVKALTDKVNALEGTVSALTALKEEMEAYVNKQKESFGYKGAPAPSKKAYDDMSAEELKNEILKG